MKTSTNRVLASAQMSKDPRFLALLLLLTPGCPAQGDDDDSSVAGDDDDATGEGTGALALTFRIDEDWAAAMDEPAMGPFRATIYFSDQVTGIGPDDGATELESVFVETVDMTGADFSTGVLYTTGQLPATWVTVLGYVDSDLSSTGPDYGPDDGDPVTLPNDNEFLVVAGETTEVEVLFDFLNP